MIDIKIGVSTYSFARALNSKSVIFEELPHISKEMGFDEIEFAGLPSGFPCEEGEKNPLEYAKKIRDICDNIQLPINCYAVGANMLDEGGWEKEADRIIEKELEIARILGAKKLRHDVVAFSSDAWKTFTFEQVLDPIANACKKIAEAGKTLGITTMVENHGIFAQDSTRVEQLYKHVNHDNFGLLVDIGNFMCVDESPIEAVGRVARYARHVHLKDFLLKKEVDLNPGWGWFSTRGGNFLRGTVVGSGTVPILSCLRAVLAAGYNDSIAIEFEGLEDVLPSIKAGLDYIKKAFRILATH